MPIKRQAALASASLLAFAAATLIAASASAQVTPSDVRDLVGARAAGGESELASRGYVNTGGQTGDDRKWTFWWNAQRGVCLSVATVNGRYDAVVSTPAPDCRQGGGGGGASVPQSFGYGRSSSYDDYQEHIALICYGEGQQLTTQSRAGYAWDPDQRRYVPQSGYDWTTKAYDTSVTIEIDGDRGRIRPAKSMLPPIHSDNDGGWYDIANLSVSRDMIRGEFKLNGLNRPKIAIDRRAGHISFEGGLTPFSGSCTPLDGDRRF